MQDKQRPLLRLLLVLCLALASLGGGEARAGGAADEADLQFQLGAEAYQKGEFRDALEHFLASNRLVPNRNVVFNIARSYEQLKRYADAHRYYSDALDEETSASTIQSLKAAIARIAPNVAVLDVTTTPPGATIYIDRKDLGSRGKTPRALAVPPGKYKVIVEIDGYDAATSAEVETKIGSETNVSLALTRIVGTVDVAIEGGVGATVHVDDERAPSSCTAPCRVEVPPGQHLLYFEREGYQAAPRQVNVQARQTTRVTASLAPLTGALVVSADERDAIIEIDGRQVGFTPAVLPNVAVGRRRVRVLLRGYSAVERDVDIKTGQQVELSDLKLIPLRQVSAVSRYAEAIEDAPSSVSIIDGQELAAFGYPTIGEALRGTRGLYVSNDRTYYSAGIRGLGEPNDYGNRLLVLSDGASLNDNLLNSSYIGSDGRDDLHDVSRIEVVRGPGSLLYGTGAFSGLVNLVPREKDQPSSVHGGIGTYDNAVARGRLGFHYNFSPKAGIWASVTGARSDGVDAPVTLNDPAGGPAVQTAHNVDYLRAGGTTGRAWYGPLTAQWFYHTREARLPAGANGALFNDLRSDYVDTRWLGELRFEPKLGENVELFTRAHANRYTFHADYAYDAPPDTPNVEDFAGTWFGGEARIAFTPVKALRITAGGEAQAHPEASLFGRYGTANGGGPYLDKKAPYNFGAGYGLIEGSPASWLRISAGARVDVYSTFGAIFVPRAAIILKPWTGGVLKLMGGRAFRAPSVYQEFYSDGGVSQLPGNDDTRHTTLKPESVISGEAELSQRFLEDWIALVAGHVSSIQDIINTRTVSGTDLVAYANAATPATAVGGDVELRREWRQGWMMSAFYSFEHAQYNDATLKDARLINAPEHLAAFKGVVPMLPDVASLAVRVTVEAPRRVSLDSDDLTPTAIVGDLALSGFLKRFGVNYVLGIYNVMDSRYVYPVTQTYLSRTIQQNGRTFLADIMVTYP